MVWQLKLIFVIFAVLYIKAILRTLYFWQLKEYRWDRFREFLKTQDRKNYLFPSLTFFRPKLTTKVLLAILVTWAISGMIAQQFTPQQAGWLVAYFFLPLSTALTMALFKPVTDLLYGLVIFAAKAKLKLNQKKVLVVGITGSYGKTATKEILAHLLKAKFSVLKTPATQNTAIGVALTILKNLKRSHQIFVVEMGAYRRGEIAQIARMVKPSIGILTGINEQHLGLFGSLENTALAKSELIIALPKNGLAIFNGADHRATAIASAIVSVKTLVVKSPKKPFVFPNKNNVNQENVAMAVAAAKHLGLSQKQISSQLKTLPQLDTGPKMIIGKNNSLIIDDSYSANPHGFLAAIKLAKTSSRQTKVLVTPGIIELGRASKRVHQQLALKTKSVFDQIYVTKKEALTPFSRKNTSVEFEPNTKHLIEKIKINLEANSLILFEGRVPQALINAALK